ncbi:MAG TPA: DUF4143 domain-containing protein [Hyphomicrobiaceae bacterium]|nr:DUF4143 domain-containing protein [Hyphomicrobiaceae bacterium]
MLRSDLDANPAVALLGPRQVGKTTLAALLDHPIAGQAGKVSSSRPDQLRSALDHTYFYRTSAGAEINLLLALPCSRLWAGKIKRSLSPRVKRGFHIACDDLKPERCLVVYAGNERVPMPHSVEAIGLSALAEELAALA